MLSKQEKELKTNFKNILKNLKIIGITGSSGKTSTCFLTYQILNNIHIKTCYIDNYLYLPNKIIKLKYKNKEDIYNILKSCVDDNINTIIIELNPTDIKRNIYEYIEFDYMLCTNILNEYQNFENNIDNYLFYKKIISKYLKHNGMLIINSDDPYSFNLEKKKYVTLGIEESTYTIVNYKLNKDNTIFNFVYENKNYLVKSNLIGKYNIYNLLQAIVISSFFKPIIEITNNLSNIFIPLRYEILKYGKGKLLIDQAFKMTEIISILNTCKLFNEDMYLVLTNNCNIKLLNDYISKISKHCIITNDDYKINDFMEISNLNINKYELVLNKKDAIMKGLSYINNGGILLILGKNDIDLYDIIDDAKKIKLELVPN